MTAKPIAGPRTSGSQVYRITGPGRAREIAATLNDRSRTRAAVVVTTAHGLDTPWVDVQRLAEEIGEYADVFLLTRPCIFAFSSAMPPGTQVYAGAARVYPVGLEWVSDRTRSPRRQSVLQSYSPEECPHRKSG